jgi:hypothetical protein
MAGDAAGDGRNAGFHLSSLYSAVGWLSWADAAEVYDPTVKAPDLMKGFVNTVLGLPFEEEAEGPSGTAFTRDARVTASVSCPKVVRS